MQGKKIRSKEKSLTSDMFDLIMKLNEMTNNEAKSLTHSRIFRVHGTRAKFLVRISSELEFWQAFISVDFHFD